MEKKNQMMNKRRCYGNCKQEDVKNVGFVRKRRECARQQGVVLRGNSKWEE